MTAYSCVIAAGVLPCSAKFTHSFTEHNHGQKSK
jgi:hypothetical protein